MYDKHSEHMHRVAAMGGAPVGGAPGQRPADSQTGDGAHVEANSIRGPPYFVDRLIGLKELRSMVGNPSVSSIYRWIEAGTFPKPVRISENRVGWKLSAVQEFIATREAA